ncbi:MAG: DUF4249 domain-containing protein [Bacteroidales bacterium]|nr:DUF4249 domain-containing protein [Bacteroidales bacterium]
MNAKYFLLGVSLFFSLLFQACQSEIEVDLPDYEPKLVVEGYIENGQPPRVMLSRSVPYFQYMDYNYIMDNVLVMDASVIVYAEDGEGQRLTFGPCDESPFRYAYVGRFPGRENMRYDLEIEWHGKKYTASTRVLHTFDLDSIGFYNESNLMGNTRKTIRVLLSDDPQEANFYQFFVKLRCKTIRDRVWVTTLPVAFDDATFNGLTFNYEVLRANPSAFFMPLMTEEEQKEYFRVSYRPGDTVYVKYGLIDYDSYQFWNTGGNSASLGQNPFTNPAPTISNIKGDNVTGVWCGYAAKTDRLVYHGQ